MEKRIRLQPPTLNRYESTTSPKRDPSTIHTRCISTCPLRSIQTADLGLQRYFVKRVDQNSPIFCPSHVIGVTHWSQPIAARQRQTTAHPLRFPCPALCIPDPDSVSRFHGSQPKLINIHQQTSDAEGLNTNQQTSVDGGADGGSLWFFTSA